MTTPTPREAERQAFETFAATKFGRGMLSRTANGFYAWDDVSDAWGIWQAARAALAVPAQPDASGVDAPWVEKAMELATTLASHQWSAGTLNALKDPAVGAYRSLSSSAREALRAHLSSALAAVQPPLAAQSEQSLVSSESEQGLWLRDLFQLIEAWRDTRDGTPSKAEAWSALWKHAYNFGPHWRARAYVGLPPLAEEGKDALRYRWLRDKSEPGICAFYLSVGEAFKGVRFARETVDEAIDAQIAAAMKEPTA